MTTEQQPKQTSKLKTALGLENLKSLSETLKEVKELQGTLGESREALSKLVEGNPVISKSIANYMDAETLNRLKSGDVTALDELRSKLEEENKTLKEGYKGLMQENQQLKESAQAQNLRQIVREELQGLGIGGGGGGYRNKMDEAVDNVLATRLDKMLGGNEQPQLTANDIRELIAEEVEKGNKNNSSPAQTVDSIVGYITAADEAKKKLGLGEGDNRYFPQAAAGGGLRSDVLKILLEDEREQLKIRQDHEGQMERNKHLGALTGAVKENMEDGISAAREAIAGHRDSTKQRDAPHSEESEGFAVRCNECGEVSVLPEKPTGDFECPKCHAKLQLGSQQPPGPGKQPQPQSRPASSLEI